MRSLCPVLALLVLSACAPKVPLAEAVLLPAKGSTTAGRVAFSQQGDRVKIAALVSGLQPGAHGFHIHEKGDCNPNSINGPGGDFNPLHKRHGDPAKPEHHAGDLPMLVANAKGVARFEAVMDGLTLTPGPANILNRSIVVHALPDDYTTQPSGNTGPSVSCGIILMKP